MPILNAWSYANANPELNLPTMTKKIKTVEIVPETDYAPQKIGRSQNSYESPITDTMQRPIRDLRISVTDRCNLRCTYCMPRESFGKDHPFLPRTELLNFEEIEHLARLFIQLGVQKIRLTGGEPLLRRGIEQIIESLAKLNTLEGKPVEVALTTNAVLLSQKAQALKDAGLARITASLDGLTEETFRRMSDSDISVKTVLEGIAAAQRVGLSPVKVNMVVKRGVNDHEIIPMVGHFRNSGIILRFIEYMDVGCTNGWRMDDVVPAREILERINGSYPIHEVDPNYTGEVAERWHHMDGSGEIGVIASVTQAFCHECTRARLSTDGKLYTCLFAAGGADLRGPLRQNASDTALATLIVEHWQKRSDRYSQIRHAATGGESQQMKNHLQLSGKKIEMSYIGG
jgi:cyclic pyranopterin phosphate synthase